MKEKGLFFVAMLIVAFQVLISFPITIWLNNQFNFSIAIWDVASTLGILFFAGSIFLLLIAFCIPEKLRNYLLPLFVLLSVLIYLQQNILVWNYGVLDGKQIDFTANDHLGLIDLGLWGLGIVAYIFLRKLISRHAHMILTFTCLVTFIITLVPILLYEKKGNPSASYIETNKFSFSAKKNIFLFVLDGFQSDLFWEFIDNEPELKDEFSGFKFYPDTASVFAKTYPTIPLLLTGKRYQKQQSILEFIDATYQDSLLSDLIIQGWDVGLYPRVSATIALDNSIMSNYIEQVQWSDIVENYLQALDLSLFRSVPHSMKSHIYNDGNFLLKGNLDLYRLGKLLEGEGAKKFKLPQPYQHEGLNFLDHLKTLAEVGSTKPTFRFYHLMMPHTPFLLNRDLELGFRDVSFQTYKDYAYASLKLMISYLKELKRIGIYDNSAIIITADHGGGEYTNKKYVSSEGQYTSILKDGYAKASGKPLLLVKGYNEDHTFEFSKKAASLIDVAPTIANFAGMDTTEFEGQNIEGIAEGSSRVRTYYYYSFTGWNSKYLEDFDVYKIDGDIYDENAWIKSGKLTTQVKFENKKDYILGRMIGFGSDIKADADYMNGFLVGNNYKYFPSHVSSNNDQIYLSLSLDSPLDADEIYVFEVELGSREGPFDVIHKGNDKEHFSYKKIKEIFFLEPNNLQVNDKADIHLDNSGHTINNTELLLSKLTLKKAKLTKLNNDTFIQFYKNLDKYYATGFWLPGEGARWTSKTESAMYFLASDDLCKNTHLFIQIKKFVSGVNPDSFEVILNGKVLKSVYIENIGQGINYYFDCSGIDKRASQVNKLVFKTDKVIDESTLEQSTNNRTLGVQIVSMKFVDSEATNIP